MTDNDNIFAPVSGNLDWKRKLDLLVIFSDSVGIEVRSSAETSSSPVEVIFARNIRVNMPSVIRGKVLGAVRVHEALHVDHGVGQGVVHLLPEDDPPTHRVGEGGHRCQHGRVRQVDVGANPSRGDRRMVDDDAAAEDTSWSKETKWRVHELSLDTLSTCEVSKLSGEVSDLVLINGALSRIRTGGLVHVVRVEMSAGLRARDVVHVVTRGHRKLVNVKASGDVVKSVQFHVENCRMEWRYLSDGNVSANTIVLESCHPSFGFYLVNLGAGQEAVRMLGIIQSEVERSGSLEVRKTHAGVSEVFLGEHGLWRTEQLYLHLYQLISKELSSSKSKKRLSHLIEI